MHMQYHEGFHVVSGRTNSPPAGDSGKDNCREGLGSLPLLLSVTPLPAVFVNQRGRVQLIRKKMSFEKGLLLLKRAKLPSALILSLRLVQ